jgi:hypothetical protein
VAFMLIRTLFCLLLQRILRIVYLFAYKFLQMLDEIVVLGCYNMSFECEMISFYESCQNFAAIPCWFRENVYYCGDWC